MGSQQKAGFDYEHEIANGVYETTEHDISPLRVGYSGNQSIPLPDVVIDDGTKIHAFEFKRTSDDRISVTFEEDNIGEPNPDDDLSQLLTFAEQYPRTVCPYIGVRFTNRQLILAKLWQEAPDYKSVLRSAVQTCPTDARLTRADNLSFHKPNSERSDADWPSARQGDDIEYLLETIDYR